MTNTQQRSDRNAPAAFLLADVEVRPESLLLIVNGEQRRVEPRVMELLIYGSERAGQLLSKEQIMQDVWGGTHLVPEALQRVVSMLRKSLDDSRDEPVFVETVSRKGYRFLQEMKFLALEEPVKLNEKSVNSSPLALIIAALILVLLTWGVVREFGEEDAWAPEASEKSRDQSDEVGPPPEAD